MIRPEPDRESRQEGRPPYALQRLLELTAAFAVLEDVIPPGREDYYRTWLMTQRPRSLHGFVGHRLAVYPHRRWKA